MKRKADCIGMEHSTSLTLVWAGLFLFLLFAIAFPLFCVLLTPKAADFQTVATSSVWKKAAWNTVLECLSSTFLSVLIGYLYAYGVVKGNIPFQKFFAVIPLIHLVTPPFVGGLAFILLLGRQGFITSTLLGLDVSLYGFWGLLIAQTLCFFPMAYMILSGTLKGINSSLEQAAASVGASKLRVFFTITLPLSMPGILSSLLFIAVSVMSDFGNPMIVAGRFRVLAVEIYTQLTGWVNGGLSAVLGILLVIPSLILFALQNRLARKNMKKTATIGGRGSFALSRKPSTLATVFFTLFCSFIALCVIAQFVSILMGTFQKIWGVNPTLTLSHVKNLKRCTTELFNSLKFAFLGAFLSTILATVASYLVYRTKVPFRRTIDVFAQLPSAIPGSLFGLAFSLAAARIHFHHSPTLIVLAITVGFLSFSYRIMSASFSQIKTTLDDGARSLGATRLYVLGTILAPIAKDSMFSSFIYDFVRGVGTMSAVIFLVSFDTPLASIKILNLAEQGFWGDAAALALLLTIITFLVLGLGKLVENLLFQKRTRRSR